MKLSFSFTVLDSEICRIHLCCDDQIKDYKKKIFKSILFIHTIESGVIPLTIWVPNWPVEPYSLSCFHYFCWFYSCESIWYMMTNFLHIYSITIVWLAFSLPLSITYKLMIIKRTGLLLCEHLWPIHRGVNCPSKRYWRVI